MGDSVVIRAGAGAPGVRSAPVRLACAVLLCLVAAVTLLVLLAAPPPVSAAPGDLLKLTKWRPQSDFTMYNGCRLVRGPGGDIWLGATGSLSASDPEYRQRVCVARYSPAGVKRWGKTVKTAVDEMLAGVTVDSGRNTLAITSHSQIAGRGTAWVVLKLSPAGKLLWRKTFYSQVDSSGWYAGPADVAVDSRGAVYVTGTMKRAGTGYDIALLKLSPAGKRLWSRYIDGYGGGKDMGGGVAVDGSDRVYVTGTTTGFMSGTDILLARYTTGGKQIWNRTWDRQLGNEVANDLAVSAAGVAVAGNSTPASGKKRGVVLHATPVMARYAELTVHDVGIIDHDVSFGSVTTNASGTVAAGGYAESFSAETGVYTDFTYARYRPGAPAEVQSYTSPWHYGWCTSVWLSPDSTLLAAGEWDATHGPTSCYLRSDAVAGSDWTMLDVYEGRLDQVESVVAGAHKAYLAGECEDDLGLWVVER